MDIQSLFKIQKVLNDRIITEHGLKEEDLFSEQQLAFIVELGELANETRCFKYWSKRSASNREVILEEYVDGLHFVLTLGLTLGFNDAEVPEDNRTNNSLTEYFLVVINEAYALNSEENSWSNYQQLVNSFFRLGYKPGFSNEEIKHAYLEKNKVNHERQDKGY